MGSVPTEFRLDVSKMLLPCGSRLLVSPLAHTDSTCLLAFDTETMHRRVCQITCTPLTSHFDSAQQSGFSHQTAIQLFPTITTVGFLAPALPQPSHQFSQLTFLSCDPPNVPLTTRQKHRRHVFRQATIFRFPHTHTAQERRTRRARDEHRRRRRTPACRGVGLATQLPLPSGNRNGQG